MNELALFAGAGGGVLGGTLLGWRTVCAVECDPYARNVLVARQNDRSLKPFPIWDDVQTFDGTAWRGLVDVVSGGFPCQDISVGGNGAGIEGSRSSLWKHMVRIVGEVRPKFVFVENSPLLQKRGLAVVIGDLTEIGYDCRWRCLSAEEVGAPHKRNRMWLVGFDSNGSDANREHRPISEDFPPIKWTTEEAVKLWKERESELVAVDVTQRITTYSDALRVVHGMANRVDRLKTLGNGQVPAVAAKAFSDLLNLDTTL